MADDEEKNYWQQQPSEAQGMPQDSPLTDSQDNSQAQPQDELPPEIAPLTWTAHEHIDAVRGPLWSIAFFVIVAVLVAFSVLLLQSWSFSLLIVVMAIAFVIYTRRPAQLMTYTVSPRQGVYVGEHLHPFNEFRAFGILQDGEHSSVVLLPRKRFAPGVSLYFPLEVGEQLVDMLGEYLPMETVKLDVVDAIVRKLRM